MSNDTEDPAMKEDCEETETFPIYVLSFIYSILAVSDIRRAPLLNRSQIAGCNYCPPPVSLALETEKVVAVLLLSTPGQVFQEQGILFFSSELSFTVLCISQVMRDILRRDFDFIKSLSPDPRLANKDHTPQEFGECAGRGMQLFVM